MKHLFLILLSFIIFINCQTHDEQKQGSTINLQISLSNRALADSVYLSLYPLGFFVSSYSGYNDKSHDTALYSFSITDSTFSFPINEGYYELVALTFGHEPVREAILIPDSSIHLDMKINFVPRGLNHDFSTVMIYGDFCDWNFFRGKKLTEQNNIWKLEDKSFLKQGSQYLLFPEQTRNYYDLNNKKYVINRKKTFSSVYNGNEIIFDPSQYEFPLRKSTVHYSGFDAQKDFSNLIHKLIQLRSPQGMIRSIRMNNSERDSSFNELEQQYAGKFEQILIHQKIWYLSYYHPSRTELAKIKRSGKQNLPQFYSSSLYKSYFDEMIQLVKSIDPSSEFFTSISSHDILKLDEALKYAPELMNEHIPKREDQTSANMYEDFFVSYLDSLEKRGVPKMEGAHLLYFIANYYEDENKDENVKKVLARLSLKYPNSGYSELIQKQFNNLSLKIGNKVPDLNLATSEGDSIKTLDLQNKFLFLFFWNGACMFSVKELPNVNELYNSLSRDVLQVVGITESSLGDAKWIENGYTLNFPNCLVAEEVLLEYGIIKYPTSYLLAPNCKIIAKDLRGENLAEQVKEKLARYNKLTK